MARTETGFAVLATSLASDSWHLPHPSPSGLHVIFCDEGGRMVEQGGDRLAFPADGTAEKGLWLEVDPVGGRLAFGLRGTQFAAWGTADSLRRNLARRVPVPFPALETAWWIAAVMNRAGRGGATAGECFVARDRIAAVDARGRIASYRLEPWTVLIRQRAGARVAGSLPRRDLICLPDRNQIAVIDAKAGVRYLDADSLADAREPGGLGGERGSMLCAAPDGRRVALGGLRGGRGFILLAWDGHPAEAAALARRPLAELTEHDLAVITAAARGSELPHAARPLLNLVRDCLAARLGIAGEPADAEPVTDHAPYQIEDKRPH